MAQLAREHDLLVYTNLRAHGLPFSLEARNRSSPSSPTLQNSRWRAIQSVAGWIPSGSRWSRCCLPAIRRVMRPARSSIARCLVILSGRLGERSRERSYGLVAPLTETREKPPPRRVTEREEDFVELGVARARPSPLPLLLCAPALPFLFIHHMVYCHSAARAFASQSSFLGARTRHGYSTTKGRNCCTKSARNSWVSASPKPRSVAVPLMIDMNVLHCASVTPSPTCTDFMSRPV